MTVFYLKVPLFPYSSTLFYLNEKVWCFQTLCPLHEMVGECRFSEQYQDFLSLTQNQNHLNKTQYQYQLDALSAMRCKPEKQTKNLNMLYGCTTNSLTRALC